MDHVSFHQMLPTQQIFRKPLDTSRLANQCCCPRVHVQTRDHLGQEDHLLFSSRNILTVTSYVYNELAICVSSMCHTCNYVVKNFLVYNSILLKNFHAFNFHGLRVPKKIFNLDNFPNS